MARIFYFPGWGLKDRKIKRRRRIAFRLAAAALLVLTADIFVLGMTGALSIFKPRASLYGGRAAVISPGSDVSFRELAGEGCDAVYFKATRGALYREEGTKEKLEAARREGLRTGLIHVFDPSSPSKEQADNFLSATGEEHTLPPAIEFRLRGLYRLLPPDRERTAEKLCDLARRIELVTGKTPVLKCTPDLRERYLSGSDGYELPFWAEQSGAEPEGEWELWSYAGRERTKARDGGREYAEFAMIRKRKSGASV